MPRHARPNSTRRMAGVAQMRRDRALVRAMGRPDNTRGVGVWQFKAQISVHAVSQNPCQPRPLKGHCRSAHRCMAQQYDDMELTDLGVFHLHYCFREGGIGGTSELPRVGGAITRTDQDRDGLRATTASAALLGDPTSR